MDDQIIEGFPLSAQQERVWKLRRGGASAFRCRCRVQITRSLDTGLLEECLRRVIERHEILRTTFRRIPGMEQPLQVIGTEASPDLRYCDLSRCAPPDAGRAAEVVYEQLSRRDLDPERGPLLGVCWLELPTERQLLSFELSALGGDADTLKSLLAEVSLGLSQGLGKGVPEVDEPVQYADIAGWQEEVAESEDGHKGRRFWQGRRFVNDLDVRLPLEREVEGIAAFDPKRLTRELPKHVVEGVEGLARQRGTTVGEVLLTCWLLLLRRLAGEVGTVLGVAFDGRKYEELEGVLGPLARYLPATSALPENASFERFLDRTARTLQALATWQEHFCWDDLADSREALFFPFCFELEDLSEVAGLTLADGGSPALAIEEWSIRYDRFRVKLACQRWRDGLLLELLYDPSALAGRDAWRLLSWYRNLVSDALRRPEVAVGRLEILDAAERHQLLVEQADTSVELGERTTLQRLVAVQARRSPQRVALSFRDQHLTFAALEELADRLARRLVALGVGPEERVALCVERSPEMVLGILAVLKAGGAYVPLDPGYPMTRLRQMLEDAQAPVLLTEEPLRERLPDPPGRVLIVSLEIGESGRAPASEELAPRPEATPQNLAYVLYTSGSTGRPKGVMMSHQAIVNRVLWMQKTFPLGEEDHLLQKTSYSFDASIWELFVPLLAGGRLELAEPARQGDAEYLLATLAERRVTHLQLVPSMLSVFLAQDGLAEGCRSLRRFYCGGEALPGDLVRRFSAIPSASLCNLYGPTEAAIDATFWRAPDASGGVVPIGRPLANVQVYLLDGEGRPVPFGVPGELHIGGAGLARAYLGRAAATAERFVPDACGDRPGARLYRSGDLARPLPGGELEFLGRIDHQVKIRGFRIELGEIEATLRTHPAVGDAVVVVRERVSELGGPEMKGLVAYVVPAVDAGELSTRQLARFVADRLPDYMTPRAIVPMPSLPRLPNGKLDRGGLPAPEDLHARSDSGYVAPRTPSEEILADLWAQLLGAERVGVHDDFFALGGHSLLATQIVSRLRGLFGVEVSVRELFSRPTVAGLGAGIARAQRSGRGLEAPPVEQVPRGGELPLSFAQQRLWFLDRLDPGSSAYNLPIAFAVRGRLDRRILARSLGEIARRHEILRSAFADVGGQPVQRVVPLCLRVPLVDLRDLPATGRSAESDRLIADEARRPFDLATGPLLRATVLRLRADEWVLLFTVHHIVSDAWSMGILAREFSALYRAFLAAEPSPLTELPVQYTDYAHWQREWLQGEVLESQLAFWTEKLADLPAALDLPTDRPRPVAQTFEAEVRSRPIAGRLSERLGEFSRRYGVTVFMSLMAAFQLLLARLTGRRDFTVGIPIAGRNRAEIEGMIGLFVNTLVLRADLATAGGGASGPSFADLLDQVREVTLDAYANQDLPFEKLVSELQPERDMSRTPLFQVMFDFNYVPRDLVQVPDLGLRPLAIDTGTVKFDLLMTVLQTTPGLRAWMQYNRDLFDGTTIRRILGHFEILLAAAMEAPDSSLDHLAWLSAAERHQMLRENNDTHRGLPVRPCLHQLFEAQVERSPEAIAVVGGRESWTYRELSHRAGRIARLLAARGIGAEATVAVYMQRRPEVVAALLGILKAGGAFVPLDPSYPLRRVVGLLEDAGAAVILTEAELVEKLPQTRASVVCVDGGNLKGAEVYRGHEPGPVHGDQLAYVIYTSGSTGRPKGVQVTHRAIVNYLSWCREAYDTAAGNGSLVHSSLAFDLTITGLFAPLVTGGTVRMVPEEQDVEALAESLRAASDLTLVKLTPSHLELLNQLVPAGEAAGRTRRLILGGEALRAESSSFWLEHAPGTAIFNEYGPTEAAVGCCLYRVAPGEDPVPIGRPVANTRVQLSSARLEPVPLGVPGELCIGGAQLARGYAGRPGLTAERFVPDPFGGSAGARLYKTGDLARCRPRGVLDFLGRKDRQVKLRGVRVELGEIESVLRRHPAVEEAAVDLQGEARDLRLVAYFVPRGDPVPSATELRDFSSESLPRPMVPSAWIPLARFPLSPSGKIDYRALREPAATASPASSGESMIPRTAIEEMLADMWRELLGVAGVGPHGNFFDLGGHSLLAIQLTSRCWESFHVELSLRGLFRTPTLAQLAEHIEKQIRMDGGVEILPLEPVSRDQPLPLSFAQQRLWFLEQLEPGNVAFNLPMSVRLRGPLSVPALERSFGEIVERHESLRTTFQTVRGEPVQVVGAPEPPCLPVIDLSALAVPDKEGRVRRLAAEALRRPMDLGRGPLLRTSLLRLGVDDHVAVLIQHHIVSDAWSCKILLQEMTLLYQAEVSGQRAVMADLPIQYADYAAWQRRWLDGEVLARQLSYWRQQLADAPPLMELPADRARPAIQTYHGASWPFAVPRERTDALKALARDRGASFFMVCLAAFKVLLRHLCERDDVIVGTDIANRTRIETEPLIGFFINQLVLRTDLGGDPSFRELVSRVRDMALGAYAHQDVPFEMLIDVLGQERSLSYAPLFQVKLVLDNTPIAGRRISSELSLSPQPIEVDTAKLDLVVFLNETSGGLAGDFNYNTDLFDAGTAGRMAEAFELVLERIVADPNVRLSELEGEILEKQKTERTMATRRRRQATFDKFKKAKPRARSVAASDLVSESFLGSDGTLPLVMTPAVPDVDLTSWAERHRDLLDEKLARHGAILFRGFGIDSVPAFEGFARAACSGLFNDNGEHPRENVEGDVYTPVSYPSHQKLLWHNENSFNLSWPRKILFCCAEPAVEGGETPIVDSRRVFERVGSAVQRSFLDKGVMYVRNYSDYLGLPWRTVFQTSDREEAESYCRRNELSIEWKSDDRAMTRAVRPAVARHPVTGELCWFNQAQHFHVACLEPETRQSLESLFDEEDLPRHCYYGDGSKIEDSIMEEILDVYRELEVVFSWQRGDVLMLDNILAAHGRNPFVGERKILVAMGEMTSYRDV